MTRITMSWATALVGGLLALAAGAAGAAESTTAPPRATLTTSVTREAVEPATLRLLNRDVLTMRASLLGVTPEVRVQRARERIKALPDSAIEEPVRVLPFTLGDAKGVQFVIGDYLLFSVLEDDVDAEAKQSFDALVKQTQARAEEVRTAWHRMRDRPLLIRGLLRTLAATAVLGLLIWIVYRASRTAVAWMEKKRDILAARFSYVDWREFLARLAVGSMQLVQWFLLLALGYAWVTFVLGSFVATEPIARTLGSWLWGQVIWLGDGVLESLPGLATIAIVLVFTRAVVDVLGHIFDAVQQGRLRLPLFHPETVSATRRILALIAWGLGVAIAYPYLPGSGGEAFKGVSVLLGVMITLGSTGIVNQAMSGLVVIYARALRKGDFVDINGVQGVVSEVASLATKVVTMRNEEITIPNSVVISSAIHNYSKLAGSQGTLLSTKVTIGYDAPWRQVHALLIEAAQKSSGVRTTPTPYVYQRALSDFYVEYELFVSIDRPLERIPILSVLHANIQDAFNEHGVQIMSPHFFAQPDQAVVVPKDQWYAAPAQRP